MTLVETLRAAHNELATKADLERMEASIRADVRADMGKMEFGLRAEIMALRNDMNDKFASVNDKFGDMNGRFATLYWRLLLGAGLMTSVIIGILGTLITLTGVK